MSWEIIKQPGVLARQDYRYARFTTVTMSNTHTNLSAPEMVITLVRGGYCKDADEARRMVASAVASKPFGLPYQSGRL